MRHVLAATLTAAAALGAGCVNDDGTVFIAGALPIDPEQECVVDAKGDVFISNGVLDISTPRGFNAALKVITNLPSTFNNTDVTSDKTQSPNFQDYGATDNNVVIFDVAEVGFAMTLPLDAVATAKAVEGSGFSCNEKTGVCDTGDDALVAAVSGSVFNPQTTLNTATAVTVEAISAGLAGILIDMLEDVLEEPNDTQRIVANIRLKGSTTGNGDLRPLSSFPFPFPIDLCNGCLAPDALVCGALNAAVAEVEEADTCFVGQDNVSSFCFCNDQVADNSFDPPDDFKIGGGACP